MENNDNIFQVFSGSASFAQSLENTRPAVRLSEAGNNQTSSLSILVSTVLTLEHDR